MSKQDLLLEKAIAKNLIDERKAIEVSNAKTLPNGDYGLCLLSIKGNILTICNTNFKQEIGAVLYKIPLNQIKNIKSSSFIFNRYLKFTHENNKFHLADFGNAKCFIEVVLEESKIKST